MGMKTFCLKNMKVIYFLQVIFYLIHLTEEKRVQSASMQEVASDCVPKGASLAKYKKASSMQCAHACIANKECSYYAVREMNKKSVRCKLYKEDDLKNGYYKEEGWMVFEKIQLGKKDSRTSQGFDLYRFGDRSVNNYVNYSMKSVPDLSAFTICMNLNTIGRRNTVLFGYWAKPGSCDQIMITTDYMFMPRSHSPVGLVAARPGQRNWCFTWKSQSGKVIQYDNGREVRHWKQINKHNHIDGGGHVMLGQGYKEECKKTEINPNMSFVGLIGNVEMWNRDLPPSEIANTATRPTPNVINWEELKRDAEVNGHVIRS